LIEIGSKTAEKNSAQTNRQTNRHYENSGHLAVNQLQAVCSSWRPTNSIEALKARHIHTCLPDMTLQN